eukprot:m.162989 g.162989  ORF g.162989 m.162989 type:complete len:53 (-) comp14615_c0_seq8:3770-3928(-)
MSRSMSKVKNRPTIGRDQCILKAPFLSYYTIEEFAVRTRWMAIFTGVTAHQS